MIKSLSIIIPVYNEENYIRKVIEKVLEVDFSSLFDKLEVIIVDDGSTDGTTSEIIKISNDFPDTFFLKMTNNSGKGAAVRAGIKRATGDLLIIQDADLELRPSDILEMAKLLIVENLMMVNGSRFLNNRNTNVNSSLRNFANAFFSFFATTLNLKKITDITCGYKLFTKELSEIIELKENRFGIEAELLTKALKVNKKKIKEYPVHYFPREVVHGKKIRVMDGFRIMWACIKYKFVD